MESTSTTAEAVLETLISRGWRFRDGNEIRTLIRSTASGGGGDHGVAGLLEAVESELLNMDLRSFGGKSLPDPSATKKSPHLHGPLILQVVSVKDIYKSSIDVSFKDSQCHRRLLRFSLTDGLAEVIAIEYAPIPSVREDVIPGTKVLLENKIVVHNSILCLNSKVVSILGGLVQSLYDEWQMSKKYSGFSRSTFKHSQNNEGVGPPPFEKLQLESCCSQPRKSQDSRSITKYSNLREGAKNHDVLVLETKGHCSESTADDNQKIGLATRTEDKPNILDTRPKEVIEALPVQNQAAAQKLLQKMNQPIHDNRHHRGQKYRGKGKQEETAVFTLDEWEQRKASSVSMIGTSEIHDVSHDEELARQLQNQLDLEDFHGERIHGTQAEQIKLNMFNYGRAGEMNDGRSESGRRGRGGGRGRGRMRGRFG